MDIVWRRGECCVCGEKGMVYDVDLPCHEALVCSVDCEYDLFEDILQHHCGEKDDGIP